METLSRVNRLRALPYKDLRLHRLQFFAAGILKQPKNGEPSGNIIKKDQKALGSMSLIYKDFCEAENRLPPRIPGISLPSVDSKSSNIYNFTTDFISTEDCLCAI